MGAFVSWVCKRGCNEPLTYHDATEPEDGGVKREGKQGDLGFHRTLKKEADRERRCAWPAHSAFRLSRFPAD